MSSLANLPDLVGFFSYSNDDDTHSDGALSLLRERILKELRLQLGRELKLWQDRENIPLGALWEGEIKRAIAESAFFIPIISPSALNSEYCSMEFDAFLAREKDLGRNDLVFPILYIEPPGLSYGDPRSREGVFKFVQDRQYADLTDIRLNDPASPEVKKKIADFGKGVVKALHKDWKPPTELRKEDAESQPQGIEAHNPAGAGALRGERNASAPSVVGAPAAVQQAAAGNGLASLHTLAALDEPRLIEPAGAEDIATPQQKEDAAAGPVIVAAAITASPHTPAAFDESKPAKPVAAHMPRVNGTASLPTLVNPSGRPGSGASGADLFNASKQEAARPKQAEQEAYYRGNRERRREEEAANLAGFLPLLALGVIATLSIGYVVFSAFQKRALPLHYPPDGVLAAPLSAKQERTLQPKDTFRECTDCPEMVVVPAAYFPASWDWFHMGPSKYEKDQDKDEGPTHVVAIRNPFAVGKLHVTVDQFAAFVRETGYKASSNCHKWPTGADGSWREPGFAQEGSHPVVCVSWDDAKAYVKWIAETTGKPYRLLSEAEFEYATRGRPPGPICNQSGCIQGRYPLFWFGNRGRWSDIRELDENALCRYGNGADQNAQSSIAIAKNWPVAQCNDGYAYTSPAGHYEANDFGLHDMAGNAWQWTEDCYHDSYNGAPDDGSAWTTACSGNGHVVRGGSWSSFPRSLRAAARNRSDAPLNDIGFRIARTLAH